ncbi:MAG: alcohol dehydrogenase catalytic domain-containing protein [Tepidisphaeraceae bacterium]
MSYQAWVAPAAKSKFVKQNIDLGPLGAEDVEVAVEHCGVCHSDLSVLNNDWGFSSYPAVLGHEAVGTVTAVGAMAKGIVVGQRVGVGWNSSSCMHCRQCMSGDQHLCDRHNRRSSATAAGSPRTSARIGRGPCLCPTA